MKRKRKAKKKLKTESLKNEEIGESKTKASEEKIKGGSESYTRKSKE